jgi:hypothetical protein
MAAMALHQKIPWIYQHSYLEYYREGNKTPLEEQQLTRPGNQIRSNADARCDDVRL